MSLVTEMPIARLAYGGKRPGARTPDKQKVLGIHATASRQRTRLLHRDGPERNRGGWIQVSRLGWPLINEVVIPLKDKDKYNRSRPQFDVDNFGAYILFPELPGLLTAVLGAPCGATPQGGRTDIVGLLGSERHHTGRPAAHRRQRGPDLRRLVVPQRALARGRRVRHRGHRACATARRSATTSTPTTCRSPRRSRFWPRRSRATRSDHDRSLKHAHLEHRRSPPDRRGHHRLFASQRRRSIAGGPRSTVAPLGRVRARVPGGRGGRRARDRARAAADARKDRDGGRLRPPRPGLRPARARDGRLDLRRLRRGRPDGGRGARPARPGGDDRLHPAPAPAAPVRTGAGRGAPPHRGRAGSFHRISSARRRSARAGRLRRRHRRIPERARHAAGPALLQPRVLHPLAARRRRRRARAHGAGDAGGRPGRPRAAGLVLRRGRRHAAPARQVSRGVQRGRARARAWWPATCRRARCAPG